VELIGLFVIECFLCVNQFCHFVVLLPARRYASAGYSDRNVSVCPYVRLSVRHAPVLCQNEES